MRRSLMGACLFLAMACLALAQPGGVVPPGTTLVPGQQAFSNDGRYHMDFQKDGNLALYNQGGEVLWASQTNGAPVQELRMQTDGNLVIYGGGGQSLWSSGTAGNPGAELRVQTDGNLVIYSRDQRILWASQSNRN